MYPEYTQCMEQRGALAADFLAALAEHPELPEKKAWRALRDVWKFPTAEPESAQHAARVGARAAEVNKYQRALAERAGFQENKD